VSAPSFGFFAVAIYIYVAAVGLCRAVTSEPLMIGFTTVDSATRATATSAACGTSLVVGIAAAVPVAGVGLLVHSELQASLFALGLVLPALLLQDTWRFAFFAAGRPARAAANDLIWTGASAFMLLLFVENGRDAPSELLLVWGATGAVAAVVGAVQARTLPRPVKARDWLRSQRRLAGRLGADFVVDTGSRQLAVLAVGLLSGVTAVGAVRGAQVFLGPLTTLDLAVRALAVPEAARLHRHSRLAARRLFVALGAILAVGALVWGIGGLVIPDKIGHALLGASWEKTQDVIPAMAFLVAGNGATTGAVAGLRMLGAAGRLLLVRVIIAPCYLAGSVVGAALGGASGAVMGQGLVAWAGIPLWWVGYLREDADRHVAEGGAPRELNESPPPVADR